MTEVGSNGMAKCRCGREIPKPLFDADAARALTPHEVRARWPRLHHTCECGDSTTVYASWEHYIAGDY